MSQQATATPQQAAADGPGPFADILRAAQTAQSSAEFFRQALQHVGAFFASPYATIYLRLPAEVIEDEFHCGPTDPRFWKSAVQQHLTETLAENRARARLLTARNATLRVALLSVPLASPQGAPLGAIALVTQLSEEDARVPASLLHSLSALMSYASDFVGHAKTNNAGEAVARPAPSQSLAKAAMMESATELAYSITNSLRNKLGCDQVALGQAVGSSIRLVSISGMDEIKQRSPGVVALRAAMEECLDADRPIRFDAAARQESDGRQYRLHRQWHEQSNGLAVASIPLTIDADRRAILSLRRTGDPFTEEELRQIHERVLAFLPALHLLEAANRSILQHVGASVRAETRRLTRPGHWLRKLVAVASVALVLWICFGTLTHTVVAPCEVSPSAGRQLAMPFDGVIASVAAVPGDEVKAGDVLCRLDVRKLELQREELLAELALADVRRLQGLAMDAPEEARIAAVQQRALQARLKLIEQQIEQAVVRAPLDGIVLSGDLRSQIGSVVRMGAPLLQVAPRSALRLEIMLPQESASGVEAGLTGRFLSHAQPEHARAFTLRRVHPSTEQRDDQNVYRVEADAELSDWIRPGMEGVAKIEVGDRPVWWVLFHRFMDPLRLNFWL